LIYYFKIYFNIILPSHVYIFKLFPYLQISNYNFFKHFSHQFFIVLIIFILFTFATFSKNLWFKNLQSHVVFRSVQPCKITEVSDKPVAFIFRPIMEKKSSCEAIHLYRISRRHSPDGSIHHSYRRHIQIYPNFGSFLCNCFVTIKLDKRPVTCSAPPNFLCPHVNSLSLRFIFFTLIRSIMFKQPSKPSSIFMTNLVTLCSPKCFGRYCCHIQGEIITIIERNSVVSCVINAS
jgi:hypothetical protein